MRDDQDLTRATEDQDQSTRVIMNCLDEYGLLLPAYRRYILDLTLYKADVRTIREASWISSGRQQIITIVQDSPDCNDGFAADLASILCIFRFH
jgi:hypothetical protein